MLGSDDTPDLHIHIIILLWKFCLIHFSLHKYFHTTQLHSITLIYHIRRSIIVISSTQSYWTKKMSDKTFAHESRGQKFPLRFSESVDSLLVFSVVTFKLHTLISLSICSCMLLIIHMQTSAVDSRL